MRALLLVLLPALALLLACRAGGPESPPEDPAAPDTVRIGGIDWYEDYDAALVVASRLEKPLWVHFGENPG